MRYIHKKDFKEDFLSKTSLAVGSKGGAQSNRKKGSPSPCKLNCLFMLAGTVLGKEKLESIYVLYNHS